MKEVHCNGSDHKNLKIPNTLLNDAARLKNDSDGILAAPYDFELPMMKRPNKTESKFIENMSLN